MRATGYVQLVADRVDREGRPISLKFGRVSQKYPREPLPGAIVLKLAVEVPDDLLRLQAEVIADSELATVVVAQEAVEEALA